MAEEEEEEVDEVPAVVIDSGSAVTKAGFGDSDFPKQFPTVFGFSKSYNSSSAFTQENVCWVGDEAIAKRGISKLVYPIDHGVVTNWDFMEKIWHHAIDDELEARPEDQPILLSEPPVNPKHNREKTTLIMFESFDASSFYLANQADLTLYSNGSLDGCVLDLGEGLSHVVPCYAGNRILHAIQRPRPGNSGRDLTLWMQSLLEKSGKVFSAHEMDSVVNIKETLSYCAVDFNAELKTPAASLEKDYELPDCSVVTVGHERFKCAEILFRPSLAGATTALGIHEAVHQAIGRCHVDIRKSMYQHVMLAGGSSMFPGIEARLTKELIALAPVGSAVKVLAPADRRISCFVGGTLLCKLSTFADVCITKDEYEENGPTIVHKKCAGNPSGWGQ